MTLLGDEKPRRPLGARGLAPGRRPLVERKRVQRAAARRLMRARTRVALTAEQRAGDPLDHGRSGIGKRLAWVLGALLVAAGIHVGIVVVGTLIGGKEPGRRERIEQVIKVEVREPPPPPPPVEEKKAEPPKPEPIVKAVRPPPVKKAPPPPEPPKGPPPRVVGLSLESTTEGGNGPAFAVGDTNRGETADRAAAPHKEEAPVEARAPVPRPAPVAKNQAATRIPVEGVSYTPPKKKRNIVPPYPETLKAQGIEADVPVMVSIDVDGKVTDVKIIKLSPYPEFNEAARAAALKEEFEPQLRDGVPIASTLSWTYRFRLETE